MIGREINNFRIVRQLGQGGMGKVFEAVDQMLDRRVAVKVLHPALGIDEEVVQRFQKEAKALGRLQHPAIVSVHSFFRQEDTFYLVMELVEGESLAQHLARTDALPWQRAVEIAVALLEALEHAHQNGLIHRDVKASNCLLTPEGQVKLTDFGIAHAMGGTRLTRLGSTVGTPQYMSPEQISGKPLDPRSDLYSLGIVLFEMVTGRVPFRADSDYALLKAQVERLPDSPSSFTQDLPQWLEHATLRALAKSPDKRFGSAQEMADMLRRGAEGPPALGPSNLDTGIDASAPTALLVAPTVVEAPPEVPPTSDDLTMTRAVAPPPPPTPSKRTKGRWRVPALLAGLLCLGLAYFFVGPKEAWENAGLEEPGTEQATSEEASGEGELSEDLGDDSSDETPHGRRALPPPSVSASSSNGKIKPSPSTTREPTVAPAPPPPRPRSPLETARAIEAIVAELRMPVSELYSTRRQHPRPFRKAISGIEDKLEDLDDNVRDALEDPGDLNRFGQLDDVQDEVRKILERNRKLQEARQSVRLSTEESVRCQRVDAAIRRLATLYETWGG